MRIISPFKDYYDSVNNFDSDKDRFFIRKEEEISLYRVFPSDLIEALDFKTLSRKNNKFVEIYSQFLLLCGKLYGGLNIEITNSDLSVIHHNNIWSLEEFNNIAAKYPELDFFKYERYDWKNRKYTYPKDILSIQQDIKFLTWAIENKISILYFDNKTNYLNSSELIGVKNYQLSKIEFQKVLDPYTAYQELDMWIGGIISQNKEPEAISDTVKIQQHGFDKNSFRKHYSENKKPSKKLRS